jgi:hypothetical protein
MKKYTSAECEVVHLYVSETKHPMVFNAMVNGLIENGLSAQEAKQFVRTTPLQMELYYSPQQGLFAVESEAVECSDIYNPYSGELLEECD